MEWEHKNAPMLILLHELGDNALCWANLVDQLITTYNIIALNYDKNLLSIDTKCSGTILENKQGSFLNRQINDLHKVIEINKIDSAIIVGHGYGGSAALSYAYNYPNKVDKLILIDTSFDEVNKYEHIKTEVIKPELKCVQEIDKVVEILNKMQPQSSLETLELQAKHLTTVGSNGNLRWIYEASIYEKYSQPSLWCMWTKLTCPILYVRGRQSQHITHFEAVTIKESQLNCRLAEPEGGGHWLHQESLGAFVSAFKWFV
jgi:pimeloyl-ACP methyl ester carboxylesterase